MVNPISSELTLGGRFSYTGMFSFSYTISGMFFFFQIIGLASSTIGKLSYILSDSCKDKFLRDAPESETAYHIREERGLPQPWTAMRDFGSKENEQDEYEPKIPELSDIKIKISISSFGDSYLKFMRTLHHKPFLSKKENDILAQCHYHANCFVAK